MSKSYFINIPPNLDKVMADNWRTVKSALNEHTVLNSAVRNPSSGLTAGSKVKISSGDSTSDYLNVKLIGGTGITFTKSLTGGVGSEILTASIGTHGNLSNMPDTGGTNTDHDTRYVAKVQDANQPHQHRLPVWFGMIPMLGSEPRSILVMVKPV